MFSVRKIRRRKKIRFVYLRKTGFTFYHNPDPDSSKMLNPDPHTINADPEKTARYRYLGVRFHFPAL
jgi:hypothetical protein